MITILIISPSDFPGVTGDFTNYYELIKAIVKMGHRVILICPKKENSEKFDRESLRQGIIIKRIPYRPPRLYEFSKFRGKNLLGIVSILVRLVVYLFIELIYTLLLYIQYKRIATEKAYLVRYHVLTLPLIFLLSFIDKNNIVVDVYGLMAHDLSSFPRRIRKFLLIIELGLISRFKKIRILNPRIMNLLNIGEKGEKKKILLSYVGVNIEDFPKVRSIDTIENFTFCFYGALEKWQGIDFALMVFSEIVKTYKNATFYIIGRGSLKEYLIKKVKQLGIEHNVMFVSPVPREKLLQDWFNKFRFVFLLRPPEFSSSMIPVKLVESLIAGKIVIRTPFNTIFDVILDKCTITVNYGKVNETKYKILRLLNNEEKQIEISKKAMQCARFFDTKKLAKELISFVRDVQVIKPDMSEVVTL